MRARIGGLVAAGLIAASGLAQDMQPPTGGSAMGPPGSERFGPEMEAYRQRSEAEREADMAFLLDLRPAQRGALHAYLAAWHPPSGKPDGPDRLSGPSPDDAPPSFAARIDDRQAHLDRAMRDEQARLAAARTFYTGLDAGQRARFEALERLDHGHHGRPPIMSHGGPGRDGSGRPAPGGPPPGDVPPPPQG